MEQIRVLLAGQPAIDVGCGSRDLGALGPLGVLAFAFLVIERHRPVPRGELADTLWSEKLPATWEPSLRSVISRVRRRLREAGLPSEVITGERGCYQFGPLPFIEVDVEMAACAADHAEEAFARGNVETARRLAADAVAVASRPFLAGVQGLWVEQRQTSLDGLHVRSLETLSRAASAEGDHAGALDAAEAALRVQPLREAAHLLVMNAHSAGGNRSGALRAYERCRRLLSEELGVSPAQATETAYLALLDPAFDRPAQASAVLATIPRSRSSFVGRDREVRELTKSAACPGLVTVVGPGGVGKTRLCLETARHLKEAFPDGVRLIELASLRDPTLLPHTAARVLGVREEPGRSLSDALGTALGNRRMLLILDNCEHVVGAAAQFADTVLDRAPAMTILASSRTPLRVPGENVYPLVPLSLADRDDIGPEALAGVDAVRLFCERAAAQGPFSLDADNADAVAAVCRRLDGMPLAIELAAARTRTLVPAQIAERLDDRFALLTAGMRTALPRQQTLRAAVDWSYDLLGPAERSVFRALAAFSGTFSLEAAEEVCAGSLVDSRDVLGTVAILVDHSLVVALDVDGKRRFRLLDTLRAYAHERLVECDEMEDVSRRLVAWATAFTESAALALGPERVVEKSALDRIDVEHDNLREGLRWAVVGDPAAAVRLVNALALFWSVKGYAAEGRQWVNSVLPAAGAAAPHQHARALMWVGKLAIDEGHFAEAEPFLEQARMAFRDLADPANEAHTLHYLAWIAIDHRADYRAGERLLQESLALYRELGDEHLAAERLGWLALLTLRRGDEVAAECLMDEGFAYNLRHVDNRCPALTLAAGQVALLAGDFVRALAALEELRNHSLQTGQTPFLARTLGWLGEAALIQGQHDEAERWFADQLAIGRELNMWSAIEQAQRGLGMVALSRHNVTSARSTLAEAARIARARDRALTPDDLRSAAALLAEEGRLEDAARLLAATDNRAEELGSPTPPAYRATHARLVSLVRDGVGTTAFAEATQGGRALTAIEAFTVAFA